MTNGARGAGLPRWTPWALWAGALAVYLLTATHYLVGADNGEFVILAATGGRAHPPGYPLYTLYLQSLSWIPALNAAHAAAMATALLGATAVAIVYRAACAWGAPERASLLAVAMFALSPQVWFLHTHAEVFALNNLIAALVLWLSAPRGPLRGGGRMVALGLVAGLGLSNHHSIVLLAPVGLYGVLLGWREAKRAWWWLIFSGLALGVGLLPYAHLLSASDCADCFKWGHITDLDGILGHFLRRDYGTTRLDYYGGERKPLVHLVTLFVQMGEDFALVGLAVGLLGIVRLLGRDDEHAPPARGALWLVLSFVLVGPAFVLLFNRAPHDVGLEVARRFYALPELVLTIFAAVGIDQTRSQWRAMAPWSRVALLGAFFAIVIASSLTRLHAYYRPTLEHYARNTLEPLPEHAILVGSGDARFLSIEYLRRVRRVRPDVLFVHASLLRYRWYADRVGHKLGVHLPTSPDSPKLARALLGTGRAVFWANPPQDKLDGLTRYPYGVTLRVLPPGATRPSLDALMATNARLFDGFTVGTPPSHAINPWAWWLYASYPRTWFTLEKMCKKAGAACAEKAEQKARAFNP